MEMTAGGWSGAGDNSREEQFWQRRQLRNVHVSLLLSFPYNHMETKRAFLSDSHL